MPRINKKWVMYVLALVLVGLLIVFFISRGQDSKSDELKLQKLGEILIGEGDVAEDGSTELIVQSKSELGFVNRNAGISLVKEDGSVNNLGDLGSTSFYLSPSGKYLSVKSSNAIGIFELPLRQIGSLQSEFIIWTNDNKYGLSATSESTEMPIFDAGSSKQTGAINVPPGTFAGLPLGENTLIKYNYREGYFDALLLDKNGRSITSMNNIVIVSSDVNNKQFIMLENNKLYRINASGEKKEISLPINSKLALSGKDLYRAQPKNRDVEISKINMDTMKEEKIGKVSGNGTPSSIFVLGNKIVLNSQDSLWMVVEK